MILAPHDCGDEIDAFGGAAREDDFVGAAGVEEFRGAGAGGFEGGGGAIAQFVDAAMDVGVVVLVVMTQRVDDGARFLRCGGVVEIDQRLAVDLLVENREIRAQCLPNQLSLSFASAQILSHRLNPDETRNWTSYPCFIRGHYINPSCSFAASVIMPWFHGGSQTSSTVAVVHRLEREQFVLHVLLQDRAHAAAGRGQSHFHAHLVTVRARRSARRGNRKSGRGPRC